jgi:hypothetical protein
VPRFYFDVREGARFIPDEEGLNFDSLDAAEAAAEIGRDRLPKGDARDVTVELKNEGRQRVLTVTVTMEIHRVDPQPLPPHPARVKQSSTSLYGTGALDVQPSPDRVLMPGKWLNGTD